VKVFSIDGSSHLVETMNGLLRTHYPPIARTHGDRAAGSEESGGIWSYYHYAASDKRGVTRFTKQGKGQKQSAGFEGGHIRWVRRRKERQRKREKERERERKREKERQRETEKTRDTNLFYCFSSGLIIAVLFCVLSVRRPLRIPRK
jgi:hypothetical protein